MSTRQQIPESLFRQWLRHLNLWIAVLFAVLCFSCLWDGLWWYAAKLSFVGAMNAFFAWAAWPCPSRQNITAEHSPE